MAIFVSGGSKGIGRAIALRFAKPGAAVFVNYHRDDAPAEATADAIRGQGAEAYLIKGDVGNRELLDHLIRDHAIEAVLHLAAESHVDRSILGPEAFTVTSAS